MFSISYTPVSPDRIHQVRTRRAQFHRAMLRNTLKLDAPVGST